MTRRDADILILGDLHLGRAPSRLPATDRAADFGPATALERATRLAIDRRVAAVLLAGDVIEGENSYFEASGPLARACDKLARHGIRVIAIAGNHDALLLPRVASRIPALELLGVGDDADGGWQHTVVSRDDQPVVRVVGWSFPALHHEGSPLATLPADVRARRFSDGIDVPIVGLLHGDLDASGGAYAPVARAALAATALSGWVLGHEHAPADGRMLDPDDDRPIGYLGCVAGCDPGEHGARGGWLARLDRGRLDLEHVAFAPVRYERIDVDISACADGGGVEHAIAAAVRERTSALDDAGQLGGDLGATIVSIRVELDGRCAAHGDALAIANDPAAPDSFSCSVAGAEVHVERIRAGAVRPALDLHELARAGDPRAPLAQSLLDLERGASGADVLIERFMAEARVATRGTIVAGAAGQDDVLTASSARAVLIDAGYRALDQLESTRAAGSGVSS